METETHKIAVPATLTAGFARRMALAVVGATLVLAIASAALVLAAHRPDWTPAFVAAGVIGLLSAIASIAVLSQAAGKAIDWLVTFVMAATVVRMGVSAIGLAVAVGAMHIATEPTVFMVCGYYAAMLIVETTLLTRATRGPAAPVLEGAHV